MNEANIQAEFYRFAVAAEMNVMLEITTQHGRLDAAVLSPDSKRILAVVECKRNDAVAIGRLALKQIERYKLLGVPVFILSSKDAAKGLVDKISKDCLSLSGVEWVKKLNRNPGKKRAKKQFNVRLNPETILAIKIAAKENDCSESAVLESWALSDGAGSAHAVAAPEQVVGVSVSSTPATKRHNFEALKASMNIKSLAQIAAGETAASPKIERPVNPIDLVEFPFSIQINDDTWTAWKKGGKYGMEFADGGFGRSLSEADVLKYWAERK